MLVKLTLLNSPFQFFNLMTSSLLQTPSRPLLNGGGLASTVEVPHLEPVLQIFGELGDEDVLLRVLASELSDVRHFESLFQKLKIFKKRSNFSF